MGPTDELVASIYREKVERARQTPIEEKLLDGPRLFRLGCEAMRAGIRGQNPDMNEMAVEEALGRRMELAERLEGLTRG
jgi:hypothetical protein